ncbi:hypothetical protein [Streptomyces sp. NPDC005336]|uniref:hypothetical protein n=1 Tax=Streptomyces sp. NPDC005336 TaxID=3157035 RepID=UPI0033BB23AA
MGSRRDGDSHIRRATVRVRGTARSGLWRAVLLLAAALWMAPSCVHPAAHPASSSTGCPHRLTGTAPDTSPDAYPAQAGEHRSADTGDSGSDNCVAGPRAVVQALVPAPVPPPALAEVLPPDGPRDPDSVRAPPDHPVRALGLHELQVLRT